MSNNEKWIIRKGKYGYFNACNTIVYENKEKNFFSAIALVRAPNVWQNKSWREIDIRTANLIATAPEMYNLLVEICTTVELQGRIDIIEKINDVVTKANSTML